jgi:hypothetical protein
MEYQESFIFGKLNHSFSQTGEDELEGKNIYPIYYRVVSLCGLQGKIYPSDLLGFLIVDVLSEYPEIDFDSVSDNRGIIFLVVRNSAFLQDDNFLSEIYNQKKSVFLISPRGGERDVFERFIKAWKILNLEKQVPFSVCGYKNEDARLLGRIISYFF